LQVRSAQPIPQLGTVAKGAFYNIVGALSRNILGFLSVFVLAKVLSVADMGLFFLAFSVITLSTITAIGGMDAGLRRFISISHGEANTVAPWEYFYTAASVMVIASLTLGFALYLSSGLLANHVFSKPDVENVIKMFIPFILFYGTTEVLLSATQGYKQMKYWVICLDFTNSVLRVAFIVSLPLLGLGLCGAVLSYDVAIFMTACLALYYFSKSMPSARTGQKKLRFREMISFSFPVALARLVNSGNGLLETILLGLFVAQAEIGVYTVALRVSLIGGMILGSFNTMFSPVISQLHHQNRLLELKQLFSCVTRWAFSMSLPLFMLIAWYAVSVVSLFGPEYADGGSSVVILCLGQVINSLTGPSGNLLLMSGYKYINLWTNLGGLALSVALNLLLIPKYGIMGCALAMGLSITIVNIIRLSLAKRILDMHPYDASYWKPFTSAALVLTALFIFGPGRREVMDLFSLSFLCLLATAGYFLLLAVFGLDASDRYILGKLRNRLGFRG
jgi:O-antigen/teichoic acid export membrane protein